jgi:hypothetical protein
MLLLKRRLMVMHGLGGWMQQLELRENLEGRALQPCCVKLLLLLRRLAAAVAAAPCLVRHCWVVRAAEIVQQQQLRSSQQRVWTPPTRHQQAMKAAVQMRVPAGAAVA